MGVTHGLTAYANSECRCDECRKAWAAYHKQRRANKRAESQPAHAVYYEDRVESLPKMRLTALGAGILKTAIRRTGHDPDDIFEALLRRCGGQVSFDDPTTA